MNFDNNGEEFSLSNEESSLILENCSEKVYIRRKFRPKKFPSKKKMHVEADGDSQERVSRAKFGPDSSSDDS